MGMVEDETLEPVLETSRLRIYWDNEEMFGVSLPTEEKPKDSADFVSLLIGLVEFLSPPEFEAPIKDEPL